MFLHARLGSDGFRSSEESVPVQSSHDPVHGSLGRGSVVALDLDWATRNILTISLRCGQETRRQGNT